MLYSCDLSLIKPSPCVLCFSLFFFCHVMFFMPNRKTAYLTVSVFNFFVLVLLLTTTLLVFSSCFGNDLAKEKLKSVEEIQQDIRANIVHPSILQSSSFVVPECSFMVHCLFFSLTPPLPASFLHPLIPATPPPPYISNFLASPCSFITTPKHTCRDKHSYRVRNSCVTAICHRRRTETHNTTNLFYSFVK